MSERVPRDPMYGKPLRWGRLYARHFPHRTDPISRHAKCIAESLRDTSSSLRKLLHDAGYEPDHMAHALEHTVKMLWEARQQIEKLGGDPFTKAQRKVPHIPAPSRLLDLPPPFARTTPMRRDAVKEQGNG